MKHKKNRKRRLRLAGPKPPLRALHEVPLDDLKAILERTKTGALSQKDREKLEGAVDTLAFLTRELEAKGTSIQRLRKLLFGPSTEKTSHVFPDTAEGGGSGSDSDPDGDDGEAGSPGAGANPEPRPKRKGHGRRKAAQYTGAERAPVPHATLQHGDPCPAPGCEGRVYRQADPATLVRVTGMAPLSATVYELERLRCNLCGTVFTAQAPAGVGTEKYDETAAGMIGLLKYGCGLPFHRLERLEDNLGIPMPAGTQWEIVARAADRMQPAHDELIRQAAQGEILHNDDTTAKILDLDLSVPLQTGPDPGDTEHRSGVFTTGIVSTVEGHRVALFFTGRRHAGENLADVLTRRAAELPLPVQMSDAESRNTAGVFDTIEANCLAHGRRRFVDVAPHFPDECRHVLETLREVYRNDAMARERKLSDHDRLAFHREHSKPILDDLKTWLRRQLDDHIVEPHSGLGEAIRYLLDHWPALTLFLVIPGAPLDNNLVERSLKKAILHRKNSYFFKTENGAHVADLFMTLIHTCELEAVHPFDYLVALQRHPDEVAEHPANWMPWNYAQALARIRGEQHDPSE